MSAFAPICNPVKCPWGEKAFSGYLGSNKESWKVIDCLFKQIDFILPWVCSVVDQRCRQNVVITKKWHTSRSFIIMYREEEATFRFYLLSIAWLFEDFYQFKHFVGHKWYFSSLRLLLFFILLVYSFSEKIFNAFTCSKHNNRQHNSTTKLRVSRSDDTRSQLLGRFLPVKAWIIERGWMALDNVASPFSTVLEPIASASFLSSLSIIHA